MQQQLATMEKIKIHMKYLLSTIYEEKLKNQFHVSIYQGKVYEEKY